MERLTRESIARVRALREKLDHPVVDADGHLIESLPVLLEYVKRVGGADAPASVLQALREATTGLGDAGRGDARGAWWGVTNDARDLACVMSPKLLAERMEEIGLDFAVLYPTVGLVFPTIHEAEVRRLACRALNTMNAELAGPCAQWMTVAAAIPMHTPAEAVAELEHSVRVLGLKAASIPPGVGRPLAAHAEAFPAAQFVDRFGIDSAHDYDPVWRAFVDLGVAVTSHGAVGLRNLECGRRSPSSYVFNHIGAHAFQQGELAKSLVLGGVPRRFPRLAFGFLEGGAGWACDLLYHLEEHYEKRSAEGLESYDPARLDREALRAELARAGFPSASERRISFDGREGAAAVGARRVRGVGDRGRGADRRDVRAPVLSRLRSRRPQRLPRARGQGETRSACGSTPSSRPTSGTGTYPISRAWFSRVAAWSTRSYSKRRTIATSCSPTRRACTCR